MSKEIMVKEESGITVWNQDDVAVYNLDSSDMLIPKLLIGQAMTKLVQDGKLVAGEIWSSDTKKPVGGKGNPVGIIPLHSFRNSVVMKKVKGKWEFCRIEAWTGKKLPWDFMEDGNEMKREEALNFYCLIAKDIAGSLNGGYPAMPVLVQFKSFSTKAGKVLANHFALCAEAQRPAYIQTFNLDTEKMTNDKGSFYVYTVSKSEPTPDAFGQSCSKWTKIVRSTDLKVKDDEYEDTSAVGEAF